MKTLYLMRHAKSSWADADTDDHRRPLAPRGERAAKQMAKHMRSQGIAPAMVICSSAQRAVQTLELIRPSLDAHAAVMVEDGLYLATAKNVHRRIQRVAASVPSLLLIGHNPTMQDVAVMLAGRGGALEGVRADFPTAALATLTVDRERWRDVSAGDAELVALVVPRELA